MPKRTAAPAGAVAAAREIRQSVKSLGAKAAAKKYGASESYVRRIARASKNRNIGKVFRTKRGLNFLNKRIEVSHRERVEIVDGVAVVPKGLADHILNKHGASQRSKPFLTQAEAIDHAKTIVGISATIFVYEVENDPYPWRYGVLDETNGDEFSTAEDEYFGNEESEEGAEE